MDDGNANLDGIAIAGLATAPPTATPDSLTVNENAGDRIIDVLANDAHIDGAIITFDDSATVGTVSLNGDNTFTYATSGQFENLAVSDTVTDTFTYTVTTTGGVSMGTVTITITGVNDDPTGGGYGSTHTEDTSPVVAPLLTFATDIDDGDTLSVDPGSVTLTSGNNVGVTVSGNQISIDPTVYDYLGQGDFEEVVYEYDIIDGNGGSTTVTATVRIDGLNDSPTLIDGVNLSMPGVAHNETNPAGLSVGTLLATSSISDVDSTSLGIAVVGADTTNGQWQYSTNGGGGWTTFASAGVGTTSTDDTNAVLLDENALIRFVPANSFSGTASPLTFRGWDQSVGASGDVGTNATFVADSAFSSGTNTVDLTVAPSGLIATDDTYNVSEDGVLTEDEGTHLIGWQLRRQIAIDNTGRTESFMDFPLLVRLDATTIDYGQTQDAGQDLRFVDANGNLLDFEIESWDESGVSLVWVRIPQIAANSNSFIWMYYGNASAADGQAPAAVWGADFQAVYHFNENATGVGDTLSDSAAGLDGTNQGSSAVTGIIGGGQHFDGSDYVDLGSNRPFARNTSQATLSAWINTDTLAADGQIVGFLRGPGGHSARSRFEIVREGNEIAVYAKSTDTTSASEGLVTTTGAIQVGQWHQVVATVDFATDSIKIYVDGQEQATSGSVSFVNNSTPDTNSMQGTVGVEENLSLSFFSGSIDEVRISTVARNADWVHAQFAAAQGSMVTIGSEVSTGGILHNDSYASDQPVQAILDTDVSHGVLVLNDDGSFSYTPTADFSGNDSFTYFITNGSTSDLASVTITVDSVVDPPTANDDIADAFEGTITTLNVLDNDTPGDTAIDPSSLVITALPTGVMATANSDGTIDFEASTAGNYSLTYTIADTGGTASNTATLLVRVSDANASSLWLSTSGDVMGSGAPGLDAWANGDVLEFGGTTETYEPAGGSTDGSFSPVFGLAHFGVDANITALHYVSRDLTAGSGAGSFTFQTGRCSVCR